MIRIVRKGGALRRYLPIIASTTGRFHALHMERSIKCNSKLFERSSSCQLLNLPGACAMATAITQNMILTYEDIIKLQEKDEIILIDVREPIELAETGPIPGSINIPLQDIKYALQYLPAEEFQLKYGIPLPTLESPIVFSCRSGNRSITALRAALEMGYKNVRHYGGGFLDWQEKTGGKK